MKKVTIKSGNKSLLSKIGTALDSLIPENPDGGTFTHARSTVDSPSFIRYVVTTGLRTFDDRVGGMPIGKSTELCGLPKSGKTNMAVRTCVRAQQGFIYERIQTNDGGITLKQLEPGTFNVTVLYYDKEGSLSDFNYRQVDGTLMDGEICDCETVELLWKTMDKVMTIVESEQSEHPEIIQFLIVVIDTVGSMTTKQELDAVWGKQDFPRVPYHIKQGFKALTSRMERENVMLIGLNHVSRKMAVRGQVAYKGWSYDSPGGMAFSYFATHQIYFEMLQRKYSLRGKGGEADGIIIYFLSQKNRLMPMLRQCHLVLLLAIKDRITGKLLREGGFKDDYSILEALIYHKAAEVSKETGAITFHFEKLGVPTTTFGVSATTPSLEESDDQAPPVPQARRTAVRPRAEAVKKKAIRISNRLAWKEFYAQHQADLDTLYYLVTDRSLMGSESPTLPTFGANEDVDEEDEETE